jgi:hypothetical protein
LYRLDPSQLISCGPTPEYRTCMSKQFADRLRSIVAEMRDAQASFDQAVKLEDQEGPKLSTARIDEMAKIRLQNPSLSRPQLTDLRQGLPQTQELAQIRDANEQAQKQCKDLYYEAANVLAAWPSIDTHLEARLRRVRDRMNEISPVIPANWKSIVSVLSDFLEQTTPLKTEEPGEPPQEILAEPRRELTEKPPRRHGPRADIDRHNQIAAVVRPYGDSWKDEENLQKIAEKLDQERIPPPQAWAKWARSQARSWRKGLEFNRERFIKVIQYRLSYRQKKTNPCGNSRLTLGTLVPLLNSRAAS